MEIEKINWVLENSFVVHVVEVVDLTLSVSVDLSRAMVSR